MVNYRPQMRGLTAYAVAPLLGLATGPVLAYTLGPAGRGEVAALLQPVTVATGLAVLGIPAAVTFFTAQSEPASDRPYRLGLRVIAGPTVVTMLGLGWLAFPIASQLSLPYWLVIGVWAFTVANAFVSVRRAWIQGLGLMRRLDMERVSGSAFRAAGVIALAILGVHEAGMFAVMMMAMFMAGAGVLWWGQTPKDLFSRTAPSRRSFLAFAGTASIAALAGYATSRLDQVLMATETTSIELGYYAVSVTVAELPLVIGVLAGRDALHLASAGASIRAILLHCMPYLGATVIGIAILVATADWYTPLFFGVDFIPSVIPTKILLIATGLGVVAVMTTAILTGRRRPGWASISYASGLAVTVGAFAALWGSVGAARAAYITVMTQFVTAAVSIIFLLRARKPPKTLRANTFSPQEC